MPGHGHVAQPFHAAPEPQPTFPASTSSLVTSSYRKTRSKKSNNATLIYGVAGAVVAVGVVIGLAIAVNNSNSGDANANPAAQSGKPIDKASAKAREFLAKHYTMPKDSRFLIEPDQVRKLGDGKFTVQSHLEIPSRMQGTKLQIVWTADLLQDGNDWKLHRLVVDDEVLVSVGKKQSSVPTDFSTHPSWLGGGGVQPSRGSSNAFIRDEGKATSAAVDRIANEIRESVKLRKTLVVWLLDRSSSAGSQLQTVRRKMDVVYSQLSSKPAAEAKEGEKPVEAPLRMVVGTFAGDVQFPLETPSDKADVVRSAMEAVDTDDGSQENTFTAVIEALKKYHEFHTQGGYVMLVVVTDEAGDDENRVEEAIKLAKQHVIAVHVIGISAPFGRQTTRGMQNAEGPQDLARNPKPLVRQGPESRQVELIDLAFANSGSDFDQIDSGLGPYSLTWLAQETGGTYFACQDFGAGAESQVMQAWNPKTMRKYAPDYISDAEHQQLLMNKAYAGLVEAARQPHVEVLNSFQTSFSKSDEASFKRLLDNAQRDVAKFEPKIQAFSDALQRGEADRPKLKSPRLQAGFDLAIGRALAARARAEGYNAMVAKLKSSSNFTKEGSSTWNLVPHDTKSASSVLEKMISQSLMYLNRVIKDHPDTPWAMMAERELQTQLGWEWTEN